MDELLSWLAGGGDERVWNDGPASDPLLDLLRQTGDAPFACPVCRCPSAHVLFLHLDAQTVGGGWAWCSACCLCHHVRTAIPGWWDNLTEAELPLGAYRATPRELDAYASVIDAHWNRLGRDRRGASSGPSDTVRVAEGRAFDGEGSGDQLREFVGFVWQLGSFSERRDVRVRAVDSLAAHALIKAEYGESFGVSVWNEHDARRPRS